MVESHEDSATSPVSVAVDTFVVSSSCLTSQ